MTESIIKASNSSGTDNPSAGKGAGDSNWDRWRSFTAEAYTRFHENLLTSRPQFPDLTKYDPVEQARKAIGTSAWGWGAAGEIRETINSANAWGMRLHEWGAWLQVVDSYDLEEDKWELLYHFVEPIAFFCMHQPSSLTDRLSVVSEMLLHQANLRVNPAELDRLDQDGLSPGKTLRRSDRRRQLKRLGKNWSAFDSFRDALGAMDGPDYQRVTRNFRDLSSHSFAPRLMIGQVARAIRSIAPLQEMVAQPDGTYLLEEHPTKTSVQYEMQVIEPLPLDTAYSANLAEYRKAITLLRAFASLIDELCARMNDLPQTYHE